MTATKLTPEERGYEREYYHRAYFEDHPGKRRTNQLVVDQLRKAGLESGRILDVGSGPGYLIRALKEAGYEAAGLDHSQEALRIGAEHVKAEMQLGDVCERIPWDDGSFDGVVLHDVIEHLTEEDAALAEIRRVLRPGGLLLLSTLNESSVLHKLLGKRWSYYQDPTHVKPWRAATLRELLERHGFEVVYAATYFDLNKAGETTAWLGPLRRLGWVVHVPRFGESVTVIGRRLEDSPA